MIKDHFVCNECDSEFNLAYNEDLVEGLPTFCPWCAAYITEEEELSDDYVGEFDEEEE
jgi:hypothetical protein